MPGYTSRRRPVGHKLTTTTPPPVHPAVRRFVTLAAETLIALAERWRDERGYESLADYRAPLLRHARKAHVALGPMHRAPFGCYVRLAPDDAYIVIVTARDIRFGPVPANTRRDRDGVWDR